MTVLSRFFRVDVQRLKERGDIDGVLKALGHKESDIRLQAVRVLGELGNPRAVEPLMASLEDSDRAVRAEAVRALQRLADPRAVEPLLAALEDSYNDVRAEAARALQQLADPRAIDPLLALMGRERGYVRMFAMRALGDLAGVASVAPILAALDAASFQGRPPDEPDAARETIAKIGRPAVPALIAARSRHDDVRQLIIELLGTLGGDDAVDALVERLRDPDPHDRRHAAIALGRLGDARALGALVSALTDRESYVQEAAAQAIDARWAEEARQPLEDHRRRAAERRRDEEEGARRRAEEEADARRLAEPCHRCGRSGVRQKQGARYWCTWCSDWADSSVATTTCDRCHKSFQYDTARYPRKPKAFCDECDAYYSGRIRDEFGPRRTGL